METVEAPSRPGRLHVKTVQGEPIQVGEKTLTPVVRIVSYGQAKGTVGTRQVRAQGGGFVQITPVAVLESTPEGQRHIPIQDVTRSSTMGILGVAVGVTLLMAVIRRVAGRPHRSAQPNV